MTPQPLLERAVARLTDAKADLLLLGGDFVSLRAEYARDLASRLATVPAPLGRYAVLGNHDYWADAAAVEKHLRRVGIEVLSNRNVRLPEPFASVSVCGMDDHTSPMQHSVIARRCVSC